MTTRTIDQTTTERLAAATAHVHHLEEHKALLPGRYRQAVARDDASSMQTLRADLEGIAVQHQLAAIAVADAEIADLDRQDAEVGPRLAACGDAITAAQQEITRALQAHQEALRQHRQALGALRNTELQRDVIRQQWHEALQRRGALIRAAHAEIAD